MSDATRQDVWTVVLHEICELANVNANSLRKSLLHLRGSENPKETADNMISSIRGMMWNKKVGEENSSIKLDS